MSQSDLEGWETSGHAHCTARASAVSLDKKQRTVKTQGQGLSYKGSPGFAGNYTSKTEESFLHLPF